MKPLKTFSLSAATSTMAGKPLRYFGQTNTTYQSTIPYGNNEKTGNYATATDGAKIYFERYGKGSPIVVLHGGLVGSPAEMGEFIDNLRQHYEVIVINTRGHGKSEEGNVAPTYQQKAADVLAVLKTAGIEEKVELLGFSDGAYTSLTFGAIYPERVTKIVAIGAGEWKKGFVQGGGDKRATFEQVYQLDPAYWQNQQSVRPAPAQTATWFANGQKNYDQTAVGAETFAKIQAPVLYIVGEDDSHAPLDTVISAYRMTKNADLSVIPNTTHPAFLENFPAIWAAITPFLGLQK